MESGAREWIAALCGSHDRLARLVTPLTPEQIRGQSYCTDWSIAQVMSHIGSGAEISLMMLPGALGEGELARPEDFPPVWDVWNAKSPDEQAADGLAADERNVATFEGLSDEQLDRIKLPFFGMDLDAVGMLRLRVGEHVLHTWDIAVMLDPAATVDPVAVTLLIDNVPVFAAPRLGKVPAEPFAVRIKTTDPDRDYLLATAETVILADWPEDGTDVPVSEISMPTEALLRLVYGRLDPEHTPASVSGDLAALDTVRPIFPGF